MNVMADGLTGLAMPAAAAARQYLGAVRQACLAAVAPEGKPQAALLQAEQRRVHGFAWVATTVEAIEQLVRWDGDGLVVQIGVGEYLAQLVGGLPMGQNEIVRPSDLGTEDAAETLAADPAVRAFLRRGNDAAARAELALRLSEGWRPDETLGGKAGGDETLDMIRAQFRQFSDERIAPFAQEWHLADALIPDALVTEMAGLGVFGVCIDEAYGGLGLGKLAMCVVSEELSRGWIAAGSLGTRSEIAGELIGQNGTAAQKARWLPGIASGEILPTAVFTEPDTGFGPRGGEDAGAARSGGGVADHRVAKTWITHAARSDLMTVLARSEADGAGVCRVVDVPCGRSGGGRRRRFSRIRGLAGSEIEVLGYRGMKEYVLSFDGFAVDAEGLLGDERGAGFRQLMQTFEGARIQTAARAVGVARNALDLGLRYALERRQFGSALMAFPRVADKIAMMAVETVMAQQITYFAARTKDAGERCDIEAGMAKLLAARVAWSNADASLQIHGGNGYALEYPISRVLCDARILNIFEGAAEIQANVVARGLLGRQG